MFSELFVAQHRAAPEAGGPVATHNDVGYFNTFENAVAALDERYQSGCWQGIRRDRTHERWWRDDNTIVWAGPLRSGHR